MGISVPRWLAGAVAALTVAACSFDEPNGGSSAPDRPSSTQPETAPNETDRTIGTRSDATLTGRLIGPDGAPLAGLPVTVVEDSSFAGVDAVLAAVFTLGIACVATPDLCDADPRVVDVATSGPDGRFELTLPQAYLPGYETDEDWVVQAGRAPVGGEVTGPSSSFELEVNTRVQESPDLAVWDVTPTITARGDLLDVDLPPLTGAAALPRASGRFLDDAGQVLWSLHGTSVDPRVLEDRSTRLVASGNEDVVVRHVDGRTIYHQSVAAPTLSYVGTRTPLSRGAVCTADEGDWWGAL